MKTAVIPTRGHSNSIKARQPLPATRKQATDTDRKEKKKNQKKTSRQQKTPH